MKIKTPHPIRNKLKYAIRYNKIWRTKIITNKKKENKKRGDYIEDTTE
jgi:hypothetical protein